MYNLLLCNQFPALSLTYKLVLHAHSEFSWNKPSFFLQKKTQHGPCARGEKTMNYNYNKKKSHVIHVINYSAGIEGEAINSFILYYTYLVAQIILAQN